MEKLIQNHSKGHDRSPGGHGACQELSDAAVMHAGSVFGGVSGRFQHLRGLHIFGGSSKSVFGTSDPVYRWFKNPGNPEVSN